MREFDLERFPGALPLAGECHPVGMKIIMNLDLGISKPFAQNKMLPSGANAPLPHSTTPHYPVGPPLRLLGSEDLSRFGRIFQVIAHFFGVELGDFGFAHAQGNEALAVLTLPLQFGASAFGGAGDNGFGEFTSDTHDVFLIESENWSADGQKFEKSAILCRFSARLASIKHFISPAVRVEAGCGGCGGA
jgi:hypothetical protein